MQSVPPRSDLYIVTARVRHYPRLSETPGKAWLAVEHIGTVLCGHCTCMAQGRTQDLELGGGGGRKGQRVGNGGGCGRRCYILTLSTFSSVQNIGHRWSEML